VSNDSDGETVTLRATSFESMALQRPLAFLPPLASRSSNPEGFEFYWRLLQYVFELPDPSGFPPLLASPAPDEARSIGRYCSAAQELAESALISSSAEFAVHVTRRPDGTFDEEVESRFYPSKEITRGFSVLFRQFYSDDDQAASFQAMQRILRRLNDTLKDDDHEDRLKYLKAWGRAQGRLRGYSVKVLVRKQLSDNGRWTMDYGLWTMEKVPGEDGIPPERLIKMYNYGDLIHWGKEAEATEAVSLWQADPFLGPYQQLNFLEAVTGLAHIYMGFSLLIRAARGESVGQ